MIDKFLYVSVGSWKEIIIELMIFESQTNILTFELEIQFSWESARLALRKTWALFSRLHPQSGGVQI